MLCKTKGEKNVINKQTTIEDVFEFLSLIKVRSAIKYDKNIKTLNFMLEQNKNI